MELINNIPENNKKVTKVKMWFIIIIVVIILLLLAAGGIWIYMQSLTANQFKFYVDGQRQSQYSSEMFLYENGKTYVSIKEIAPLLGYRIYNGGYGQYTEDTTKCYINNSKEVASFETNSSKIYKYNLLDTENTEGQMITIDEPIKASGTNLYVSTDGLAKSFNVMFTNNQENNSISIFTLNYLANYYSEQIPNAAITIDTSKFSESILYNNQKAVLYNMIVIKDPETDLYGMATIDNPTTPIIGMRYSSIEFLEGSNDFIVMGSDLNSKYGIIGSDGVTKVRLEYDSIIEIGKNLGLYLVTSNNRQGIINRNGKVIVYQDYDQIGLPTTIQDNNVTNKYILYNNCIPVKRNNLWGLVDINGNQILPLEYDGFGCSAKNSNDNRYSDVLIIPELDGIVVEKDETIGNSIVKKYGIIRSDGSEFINIVLDSVYSLTLQGETTYYASVQNQIIDIVDFVYQQQSGGTDSNTGITNNTTNNYENNTITNNEIQIDNNM